MTRPRVRDDDDEADERARLRRRLGWLRLGAAGLVGGGLGLLVAVLLPRSDVLVVIALGSFGIVILASVVTWAVGLLALTDRLASGLGPPQRRGAEFLAVAAAVATTYLFLNWWFSSGSQLAFGGPLVAAAAVALFGRRAERLIGLIAAAAWVGVVVAILLLSGVRLGP